jgi:AbrB family looped-hinge helix DNA binding protein
VRKRQDIEGKSVQAGGFLFRSASARPIFAAIRLDIFPVRVYNTSRETLLSYFPTLSCIPEVDMSNPSLVNDARVMAKGQVTIPKNIRAALGVSTGDRVTFIVENGQVTVVNSAVYAMRRLQEQMKGEAIRSGLLTEEEVAEWITRSRREEAEE